MSKLLKISVITILVAMMTVIAACSGVTGGKASQRAADQINEAVNNGTPMTVAEVKEKYGDPTSEGLSVGTGYIVYVNGCYTWEDFEEKMNNGQQVEGLLILCLAGYATVAVYYDNYQGQTD